MDYGSIKNKLLIHATCVNLMIVILSKASQTKKNHCVADWLALSIHLALCAMLPRDKSSKGSDIFQVKFQILNSIPLSLVSLRKSAEIFDFIIPQIPKHKRSPKRTLLKKSNRRLSRKHPGYFSYCWISELELLELMSALSFLEGLRWHVLLSTWTANPVPSFPTHHLILPILLALILAVGTLRLPWGLTKLLRGSHGGIFTPALGFLRDVTALKPPSSSGRRHAPEQLRLKWRQMPLPQQQGRGKAVPCRQARAAVRDHWETQIRRQR